MHYLPWRGTPKGRIQCIVPSEALAKTESGKLAIIPGDPDHSEMIKRITKGSRRTHAL